jgi:uracil-DNA glycosylase family 4
LAEKNSRLRQGLEEELRFLSEIGAEFIFAPQAEDKVRPARKEEIAMTPIAPPSPGGSAPESDPEKLRVLRALEEKILSCTLCPLARGRTRAVPGEGNASASLMFVGEGPGADEDIQGRPFVGRAGQLLTKIIAAMNFKRSDVYITNVVKCRPPQNRTPFRNEMEKCRPYLLTQLETIAPRVIVSLGKSATDFFQPSAAAISGLRGNFIEYGKILIMPTFHPSYLMRNEGNKEIKRLVWQDMQKVMDVLSRK